MNRSITRGLCVCLSVVALASCQDYDAGFDQVQVAYETQFKKVFGPVDPNHDWNLSERCSVNVTPGSSSDIKIYAKIGDQYRLVADYEDVVDAKELFFDAIDGTSEVMVSDGRSAQYVQVGGSVSFAGTRTIETGTSHGVTISESSTYWEFNEDIATAFKQVCPEGQGNSTRVTCNYTLVSNGSFTIYPVYFYTGSWSELGVYYKDGAGDLQLVKFYTMKHGDDFQYYNSSENAWSNYTTSVQQCDNVANHGTDTNDKKRFRSKGITINMPAGTVFGMYIKVLTNGETPLGSDAWINYSETELNVASRTTKMLGNVDGVALSGFYTVGSRTYFSFEDWNGDNDLNDMVFMFDGSNIPTPVDNTAAEWIVACEDLNVTGSFDDEDFNDIVLKVSHGSYKGTGYTTMNVTPLAAVGTYRSDIYVNETKLGEIHELVSPGVSPVSTNLYAVINGETIGTPGPSITVACESGFSLDAYIPGSYNSTATGQPTTQMGGIKIKSYRSAEDSSAEDAKTIAPNAQRGTAGAMFCIPASWTDANHVKHTWCWPKETTNIASAYPSFTSWVSNMSANTDWYKSTPVAGTTVTGAYSTSEQPSAPGGGSSLNDIVCLSASTTSVSLSAGGDAVIVTLTSGSDGSYSLVSGNTDLFSATLDGATITLTPGSIEGSGSVVVSQAASSDGTYGTQTLTISVSVGPGLLNLTLEAQSTINWGESHYYKISVSDDSYLVAGAVIEFVHSSGYSDVCLTGTSTTWAQVGKSDGNYKDGKVTLTAEQASSIKENGGFYAIVWNGDITSIKMAKPNN